MRNMWVLLMFLPLIHTAIIPSNGVHSHLFERKICGYGDACEITHPLLLSMLDGSHLSFCDCPNQKKCTVGENTVVQPDGTLYVLCEETRLPTCEAGEISKTSEIFQWNLKCICPSGMVEKQIKIDIYSTVVVCDYPLPECKPGEMICGYYDGSRTLRNRCECPRSHGCIFSYGNSDDIMPTATCQRLA